MQGDYADYYKRIREMAKDKGMKEDDVLLLLKQRQKGENAYKAVSNDFKTYIARMNLFYELVVLSEFHGIYESFRTLTESWI